MRYAMGLEYDGSYFIGWQTQDHGPGVQAAVEKALSGVADHPVAVTCAGRTDSGVHATGQVVHFDSPANRSERSWLLGTNAKLPDSVAAQWLRPVDDQFHARFSALSRSYRYRILNRWQRAPLSHRRELWFRYPLDAEAMHQAAQALLGEHDFSAFRAAGCQAQHAVREIREIAVLRHGDHIDVTVRANAFLYHMVRNIVGSLLYVGQGRAAASWAGELLAERDRTRAAPTAAADGLYFTGVRYPAEYHLPESAVEAFPDNSYSSN